MKLGTLALCLAACAAPATQHDAGSVCAAELAALEADLAAALDDAAANTSITTDPDLTLLLEAGDGRRFSHSHGASTATSPYASASTSKLVAAVVILDLVDQGVLSLDSKPSELLLFWTSESAVTLRHLLAFTSGFHREPCPAGQASCLNNCVNMGGADFATCVQEIHDANVAPPAAGSQFYYASTHLQIAGLMAMQATGKTWSEIFAAWKTKTGLFPTGAFDLPSSSNPRLAGGMHWRGEEYLGFLRALARGTILTPSLRAELFGDQRGAATVAASPIIMAYGEDWSYGLGNWLECPTAMGAGSFDCGAGHRNSSPGAYGAYPFIDFERDYFGVLAREGTLGTFREGLAVFRAVEELADQWAAKRCPP